MSLVKQQERTGRYEISVKERDDGYVSRISFKLGNERNPRVEAFGVSTELAVQNLLYKMEVKLEDSFQCGQITTRISNCVTQKLIKSINDLEVNTDEIMESVSNIIKNINYINSKITDIITMQNGIISDCRLPYTASAISLNMATTNITNTGQNDDRKILLESFAKEWFKYKLSLCKASSDNPRPLSQKTVDGYHSILFKKILPFMAKNKIVYLQQIDVPIVEKLLKEQNGYDNKRLTYIVLSMLFKYAVKKKNGIENLMLKIDKPKKPARKGRKTRNLVTRDIEEIWMDKLEEENTDVSLIYLTILTLGTRPEEAASIQWKNVDFENDTIKLDDAYKSFAVYDDDCNIVGRDKRLDKLKTEESYRTVILHPRLKKALLKHKEEQKERFKNSVKLKKKKRFWSEEEYVFQSRYYRPYLTSSLDKPLRLFIKKYNMGKIVPYSLRGSWATNSAERGMDRIALSTALGHAAGSNTAEKYYIMPSYNYMKEQFNKVFSAQ